jgi:two-component system NtrC family sensor kinase
MASLFVIQGRDQGKRFDLRKTVMSVGRESANAIQLHDTEVSRHHAEIREHESGYTVVDLESSNGLFVNDRQVEQQQLRSGDRVQLGSTLLIYTGTDDTSPGRFANDVDIVGRDPSQSNSRIVTSMSHDQGSQLFSSADQSDSPWLARARSNLQVMYRTALAVSHTLDIDQLLHRIMELIFEWVEADRGCIMLIDQGSEELIPKVSRNREKLPAEQQANIEISRTILDYVLEHKEGVLTSDAREDQRWDSAASIVKMGVREAICVPMQGRYGMVGVTYIDTYTAPGRFVQRATNKFSEEHLKLMIAIAHQAALAVEDTSYYSAMVQAERLAAMGQTIATLSHHIKNILQGIRGGSYLIEEGLKNSDSDIVRKGWGIVEKNQERISHLVLDMLTFSKDREPDVVPAMLNEVVADVVELTETRATEAGVTLKVLLAEGVPELMFDPEMLHRAILNVVTNAIDACNSEGKQQVTVATEQGEEDEAVRVIIEDTGVGIEPADLKKIFSIFESRKGNRGTGLGLPVSQKILREHGGDIRVESIPASGSRFILEFPAVHAATARGGDTMTG